MSSGYRPPSTEPQGRWARHIHAVRKERGWSQTRGFERARENGLPLGERSRSAYIAIDMGERLPTPAEEPSLIATYGLPEAAEPEHKEPATPEGMAGLVEEIRGLTRMMAELVNELRELRGLPPDYRERVAESTAFASEHERRRLADRPQPAETEPDPPPGSLPTPVAR